MILDTHVHFYDPVLGDFSWPPRDSTFYRPFTPKMLAAEAGSALASCVAVGCANEYELNCRLLGFVRDEPLVGAYIAQVDLSDPQCASYVSRYAMEPKYRGFRTGSESGLPYADRIPSMQKPGFLVELLGNWKHTVKWSDYIAAHPEIPFVVEHFGGYLFDGKPVPQEYRDFCRIIASLPNTAIKLSGCFTLCRVFPKPLDPGLFREAFAAAYDAFGPDRCMFGSDWPVCGVPYAHTADVTRILAGDGADKVLYETAKRIYRIPD